MEPDEISIKEILNGEPFAVEKLNTEGAEAMADAREKYNGDSSSSAKTKMTEETIYAILLSSDSLMKKTKLDIAEYRKFVRGIASKSNRMKIDTVNNLVNLYRQVNEDFLSVTRRDTKPKATSSQDLSLQPQQDTQLSMPQE